MTDWMEKSLNDNEVEESAEEISPKAAEEIKQKQLPAMESEVEEELESLPEEEESSGSIEEVEDLFAPGHLSKFIEQFKRLMFNFQYPGQLFSEMLSYVY